MTEELINSIVERGTAAQAARGTYVDNDGVLRCAVCHEPVRHFVPGFGDMPSSCECDAREDTERKRREAAIDARRRVEESSLRDRNAVRCCFADDLAPDSDASIVCRSYAEHWQEMRREALGLMLSGTMGTGKSFYAACIVDALIEQGVPALMFSTSRLVSTPFHDVQGVIDEANAFPLCVLDDLGAERRTDYSVEILEAFINGRYIARRPLIVTTNMTAAQMQNPSDLRLARVFDRLRVMCPRMIVLTGESRRGEQQLERAALARELLGV